MEMSDQEIQLTDREVRDCLEDFPTAVIPQHLMKAQGQEARSKASNMQIGGTHYMDKKIQPWDAMEAWMSPEQFAGYLRGCALKYLARCDDKGGVEDIKKARHYLDKLIEFLETQKCSA